MLAGFGLASLWPKAWQIACRAGEVGQPGGFTVYDI